MDYLLPKYCVKEDGTLKLGLYCLHCSSIEQNLQAMSKHMQTHHPGDAICHILLEDKKEPKFFEEPRFKCEKCPYYNCTEKGMDKHWEKYHRDEKKISYKRIEFDKDNPFPCIECGNKYFNMLMAALHWYVTHGTGRTLDGGFGLKTISEKYKCGNVSCKNTFDSYADLKSHYDKAHKEEDFYFLMIRKDVSNGYLEYVYSGEKMYRCDYYDGCKMEFGKNKYDAFYHHLDKHYKESTRLVSVSHGKDGFVSWKRVLLKTLFSDLIAKLHMQGLFE